MSFKIRHAGSPQHVSGQSAQEIVEAMQDGLWEGTDEVMGPNDRKWIALEDHPVFREAVEAMEEAAEADMMEHDDDHIDMNPLIDVCLVLLVFFILATTMSVMEKVLDMPQSKQENTNQALTVTEKDVREKMIFVKANRVDGKTTIMVETKEVSMEALQRELQRFVTESGKTELVIDAKGVEWGTIVGIIDAASGARITKVNFKTQAPGSGGGAAPAAN
jgi:biopolymer transport protein ExbD